MIKYVNPIIPGFYPDPSICRVGNDYYLVNSSFGFFPGVPLFHSIDLIHWQQIGHVLTRKSQLELPNCRTSGGIYAPTLRHSQGRFYMTTTNVNSGGNFYVWTDDIRGEWSDPIWIAQGGIDPSLFWDDDGSVYFSSTFHDEEGPGIGQCVVDINTGKMLTETKVVWHGSGGKCPEGPHLYKRNGFYYLMIAEGGTEYGHMETIARSSSPSGPFESCPRNPILTHRDQIQEETPFQGIGHADLVDTPEGEWWIVFHGIRPSQFMLHHLGRETMIAPVEWDADGWPVVNGGRIISQEMRVERKCPDIASEGESSHYHKFRAEFGSKRLDLPWNFLCNPEMSRYVFTEQGSLELIGDGSTLDDLGSPTFLGVRQQHFNSRFQTLVEFDRDDEDFGTGLTIFHTNEHHYDILLVSRNGKRSALLRKRVGDMITESNPISLPATGKVLLRIISSKDEYVFFAGPEGKEPDLLGTGRTQLISTECMVCTFTGCFCGIFAQGEGKARFDWFEYDEISY